MDFMIPQDHHIDMKENKKIDKYLERTDRTCTSMIWN